MTNFNFKYYKPTTLVGFIIISGTIINLLINYLTKEIQWFTYFSFPSTSAIIIMFLGIYDKFLWKRKILNFLVWIPNIQGRYEGDIIFQLPISNETTTMKCIVLVKQTASLVKINSFFKNEDRTNSTPSESKVANIVKEEDNTFSLIFTYENKGTPGGNNFAPHYGTNQLKFIDKRNEKLLFGYYYTNRTPQTKGEMKVKLINNNLHHEF